MALQPDERAGERERERETRQPCLRREAGDLTYATNQTGEQIQGCFMHAIMLEGESGCIPSACFVSSTHGYPFRISERVYFGHQMAR